MTTGGYSSGGTWDITEGWDVVASDGEKIGTVDEVHPHYLVVGKGLIFHSERYVPVSAITSVESNTVYLNVTQSQIENLDWDTMPTTTGTTTPRTTDRMGTAGAGSSDYTRRETEGSGDYSIPVAEEELDVHKRQVERGSVHVHKEVTEEVETANVPVREESVRVERHAGSGERADVSGHTFQEESIASSWFNPGKVPYSLTYTGSSSTTTPRS